MPGCADSSKNAMMKMIVRTIPIAVALALSACGTADIVTSSKQSYRSAGLTFLSGPLALLPVMEADARTIGASDTATRAISAPYSDPILDRGESSRYNTGTGHDRINPVASDILAEKIRSAGVIELLPPRRLEGIVGASAVRAEFLAMVRQYRFMGAQPALLKRLAGVLRCRYLLVPQLVVISNVNDSHRSFVWSFGKRTSSYSVILLGDLWDLPSGDLVWSGRGVASTRVGTYEAPAFFDELAGLAADELVRAIPVLSSKDKRGKERRSP